MHDLAGLRGSRAVSIKYDHDFVFEFFAAESAMLLVGISVVVVVAAYCIWRRNAYTPSRSKDSPVSITEQTAVEIYECKLAFLYLLLCF
jgi:hypothetical protein